MTASRIILKPCLRAVAGVVLAIAFGLPQAAGATQVLIDTSLGPVHIQLFDQAFPAGAPQTVANFLNYVDRGAYDRTIIHRSIAGFVVQGGGYTFPDPNLHIATDPPVVNEFSATRSNLRGTVAMAKLGGDPNSATSEWFFNLSNDNAANLDNQNGGFTVFGQVLDTGMDVVDAIAALPLFPPARYPGFSEVPNLNNDFVYVFRACRNDDLDGACTVDEGQAAGGDGNGDTVQDSVQDNVASVLNAKLNNASMTYAADPGIRFETASAGSADSQPLLDSFTYPADPFVDFDQGVHAIAMTGTDPSETVTLFDNRASARPTKYYVYDPASGNWSDFSYDGTTGAEIRPSQIVLHFVDNDRGDSDLAVGTIRHIGAPATESPRPSPVTPTIKTVVLMQTPYGAINIGLYDDVDGVPETVNNFLGYVDRGDYDGGVYGGTIIHFKDNAFMRGGVYSSLSPLPRIRIDEGKPTIANQSDPTRPNAPGTISMWWGDQNNPDSAKSEWSINLTNNYGFDSATPGKGLTVFGRVLESGMEEVVAEIGRQFGILSLVAGGLKTPLVREFNIGAGNDNFTYVRVCRNNDLDGACTVDEVLAPNNGDGNSDGTPDSEQGNVASMLNPVLNRTVTAVASSAVRFDTAVVRSEAGSAALFDPQTFTPPLGVVTQIAEGVYEFIMSGVNPAGEQVTILNRGAASPTRYYVALSTPTPHWEDFSFDETTGAEILGNRIVLHLVDGGRGDDDGQINGKITHHGAPATESPVPAPKDKNDWGCAIGNATRRMSNAADWGVVAAFLAFVFVRRRTVRA